MSATVPAHRVEATVEPGGTLTLARLPFAAGEAVEVIVLPRRNTVAESSEQATQNAPAHYPLRGSTVFNQDPFSSVAEADWNAAA